MPVTFICKGCGKSKTVPPSRINANGNYCSIECTRKAYVTLTCQHCGNPFDVPENSLRHHVNKYCSSACKYEAAKTNPVETIMRKIDRSGGPDACWPYNGLRLPRGYGTHTARGRHWYAHRVAYEVANGPIPDGLWVLHRCDNPPCCNPAHLFLGTMLDNTRDMIRKGRNAKGERMNSAKLTEADVIRIRELAPSVRVMKLAEMFGVSHATIRRVVSGEAWKHVKSPQAA